MDGLTKEEQEDILWQAKMKKAAVMIKRADEILKNKPVEMTEEEVVEMVSNNRKKWYEEEQQKNK